MGIVKKLYTDYFLLSVFFYYFAMQEGLKKGGFVKDTLESSEPLEGTVLLCKSIYWV